MQRLFGAARCARAIAYMLARRRIAAARVATPPDSRSRWSAGATSRLASRYGRHHDHAPGRLDAPDAAGRDHSTSPLPSAPGWQRRHRRHHRRRRVADLQAPLARRRTVAIVTPATVRTGATSCVTRRRTFWPKPSRSCSRAPSTRSARPSTNGFYYDFDLPDGRTFSDDDLAAIEAACARSSRRTSRSMRSELDAAISARAVRRPAVQAARSSSGRRPRRSMR